MKSSVRRLIIAGVVVALASLAPLQRWIDDRTARAQVEDETLYLSNGEQVKRLALGYDALLADVYWMRAIQHFGENAIANRGVAESDRTPPALLAPLLDVATTLDPQYIAAYRFGGYFLADYVDEQKAVDLLNKGIRANPHELTLHLDLGFLYWRSGDCESASAAYAEGGRIPGAAPWVAQMSAVVLAECGKRDFAMRMLKTMYDSTDDPRVREELVSSMKSYQALDEIDFLKDAVGNYVLRFGSRPQSLALLVRTARLSSSGAGARIRTNASGQPVDPNGEPYIYDPVTGGITTNPDSIVLPKFAMRRGERQPGSN